MDSSLLAGDLDVRRRRAVYRAQHRGTKEMDVILGRYAQARLPAMSAEELSRFERLLLLPDPDLQTAVMTGGTTGPADLAALLDDVRCFHGLAAGDTGS